MTCTRPVRLYKYDITVPCGKCLACRMQRSKEWATRLLHELDNYNAQGIFITLTYNDEYLPEDKSIRKKELQDFFKRLRKRIDGRKIKYYACGEYGEQLGRPHYHAIILGLRFDEKSIIERSWVKGTVHVGTVTYDSCRYVADYVFKKYNIDYLNRLKKESKVLPFQLQSQGIGKDYAIKNKDQIISNLNITIKGRNVGIPRYYKKILNIDKELIGDKARERNEELNALVQKAACDDVDDPLRVVANMRYQQCKNNEARVNIKKDRIKKYNI